VAARYPHDSAAYTQGLFWADSVLFESTGKYGHSEVRRVDLTSGRVLARHALAPDRFGEGLALVGGRLYQLTWKEGVAYVYDPDGTFKHRCNPSMVTIERVLPEAEQAREERELAAAGKAIARHLDRADDAILRELCEKHLRFTGSGVALALLDDWDAARSKFVKVFPNEYRRALGELAASAAAMAAKPATQKAAA